jgi:flagellar motility protein MotE (MotC chaperone)
VLRAAGIVEADESVRGAYRFSELTLLVTDRRLVKHVGAAVWDEEYDVAPFADLTGLAFEEGSVGTEVSVEVDGYPQRFKIPNEHAGSVRKTLQNAVFAFHDVDSLAELDATVGVNEETESDELAESGFTEKLGDDDGESEDDRPFADLTAPELDRDRNDCESMTASAEDGEGTLGRTAASGIETDDGGVAGDDDGERPGAESVAVAERLNALEAAVERQSERIEEQRETIERLVEELRRGR